MTKNGFKSHKIKTDIQKVKSRLNKVMRDENLNKEIELLNISKKINNLIHEENKS